MLLLILSILFVLLTNFDPIQWTWSIGSEQTNRESLSLFRVQLDDSQGLRILQGASTWIIPDDPWHELGEVLDFWLCWREPDWSTVWVQIRSRFVVQFMTRKTSCVIWRQTQNFSMIHGDRMIADWLFFFSFCVKACFCKSDVKNQFNLCWRTERWNRTVVLLIFSPVYKVQYIYCFLSLLDSS